MMLDTLKNLVGVKSSSDQYWIGPYGIRVHKSINSIRSKDGSNTLSKDGGETEMFVLNPISEQEYKMKYTEFVDGYYYYNTNTKKTNIQKCPNITFTNPTINHSSLTAFKNGTYYNPANKHYNNAGIVQCDMCNKQSLQECIGYENVDLCMECVLKISNSPLKNTIPNVLTDYWNGPFGVRVPNNITYIIASDGYNTMYNDGIQTARLMSSPPQMNEAIYRQKFAELRNDGYYYYKPTNIPTSFNAPVSTPVNTPASTLFNTSFSVPIRQLPGYWVGPFNVRIPNAIHTCVASDGYNTRDKYGGETEMFMIDANPMNEAIYRQKYAELRNDGYYYYKEKLVNNTSHINQKYGQIFDDFEKHTGITFNSQPNANILKDNWCGPYGVLVPKTLQSVPAGDGGNELYQDGSKTQSFFRSFDIVKDKDGKEHYEEVNNVLSESEYKNKYSVYRDGYYYWNVSK